MGKWRSFTSTTNVGCFLEVFSTKSSKNHPFGGAGTGLIFFFFLVFWELTCFYYYYYYYFFKKMVLLFLVISFETHFYFCMVFSIIFHVSHYSTCFHPESWDVFSMRWCGFNRQILGVLGSRPGREPVKEADRFLGAPRHCLGPKKTPSKTTGFFVSGEKIHKFRRMRRSSPRWLRIGCGSKACTPTPKNPT